jgi:hypothetical protein
MPVSMGILCERCRTVYFISRSGKSAHIHYERARGEFKLACDPPCKSVSYFHRTMLRPYSASAEVLERGHADISECQPIGETKATQAPDIDRVGRTGSDPRTKLCRSVHNLLVLFYY